MATSFCMEKIKLICKKATKNNYAIVYNTNVATPRQAQKGGVCLIDIVISFLVSVMASVAAYYICKWLDRDDHGNQPED